MHRLALLSAAMMAVPLGLAAQETRQLDAHVHGESKLNMAIEGNAVAMELEAPSMDIVGFEHQPSNDEQRVQVQSAIEALSAPLDVFVFPEAAGCEVATVSAKQRFEEDHNDHGASEAHDEHRDVNAENHASAENHDERHEGAATHSEFRAVYELACANPDAIDAVDFAFFVHFPMADAVEVQIITERGQAAFEVKRTAPSLELEEVLG